MDVDPFRVRPYKNVPDALVHAGFEDWYGNWLHKEVSIFALLIFFSSYESVAITLRPVVQKVVTAFNITTIVCTGHSLGAAMSGICGLDMRLIFGMTVRVKNIDDHVIF